MSLALCKVVYLDLLSKELLHEVGLALLIHQRIVRDKFADGLIGIDYLWRCHTSLVPRSHLMIFLNIESKDNFLTVDSLTYQGAVSTAIIRRPRMSPGATTLGSLKP